MVAVSAAALSTQNATLPEIPELYNQNFLDTLLPPVETVKSGNVATPGRRNLMMDALQATAHHALTANGAPALSFTNSKTLDAFQGLSSFTDGRQFVKLLEEAWNEDAGLTLRIIWNLRSIHDGKGDKETFYRAFGWLYDNHPRTAISNLHLLVDPVCTTPKGKAALPHGYWKDLLNILALATVDELSIFQQAKFLHAPRMQSTHSHSYKAKNGCNAAKSEPINIEDRRALEKVKRVATAAQRYEILAGKLAQPKYRALYVAVARLLAERLAKDIHILDQLNALGPGTNRMPLLNQLSLAGKWAPTPQGAHDRHTNIATAISLLLRHNQVFTQFPSALNSPLAAKESAIILRSFYQRWVLTPLRKVLRVPETLMTANKWTEIQYEQVSLICMKSNTEIFFRHDPDRFQSYMMTVEKRKKKISGATLLPHELVAQVMALTGSSAFRRERGASGKFLALKTYKQILAETRLRVVEAQWKTLIERLHESGTIENSLAICDVSGSMGDIHAKYGEPYPQLILPAVSLALVLAHLAKPPYNGGFITFSSRPQYVQLDLSRTLQENIDHMVGSDWGMNTDLNAVFLKLLLPLAVKNKVKREDMIKRLFIFSDRQFDESCCQSTNAANWEKNYDAIAKAYKEVGYEVPQIVYWDLAGYGTLEVQGDRKGVTMMNGFSPALLKVFLGGTKLESVKENGETEATVVQKEFTPVNMMKKTLLSRVSTI